MLFWHIGLRLLCFGDRCAEYADFCFDMSVGDLYPPLTVGASLYIVPESVRRDFAGIYNYIKNNNIDCFTMSTAIGMELLKSYDLPLRVMTIGGEKMYPVKKSSVHLINAYGPTEFTVWSSIRVVDYEKDTDDVPIGLSVPNCVSMICDSNGQLLPKGVSGELCLAGPQIAEGYWHRPELTAEKFVD